MTSAKVYRWKSTLCILVKTTPFVHLFEEKTFDASNAMDHLGLQEVQFKGMK